MTTGERIRQLRIEHQMTQEELGAKVGVQKAAIYKYENGLVVNLKRSILEYNQEFEFWGTTRKFYSTSDIEAGFMINKYMDPFKYANASEAGYVNTSGDWPTARINFPLIRFAEMLFAGCEQRVFDRFEQSLFADLFLFLQYIQRFL